MLDFIDLHQFSLILLVFTRYAPAPIFKMSTKNMSRINLVHFFFLWPHQIVWRTRFQKSFCFRAFYRIEKNCTTNLKFSTWNSLEIHAPGLWRHFISRIPSNYSTKLSKILDFSEMLLSSRARNFSQNWNQTDLKYTRTIYSTRSLHFCNNWKVPKRFQKSLSEPNFEDFGIFSLGDVEHPTDR